ncbi:hypothetical protein CI610_03262 [invertebrate metagenome]|uniref:Uncharacterized protein n=1 Tax=invertebrate metagenome TaxID=1711999 RepID=A0A2H9T3L3_9ZZZZ
MYSGHRTTEKNMKQYFTHIDKNHIEYCNILSQESIRQIHCLVLYIISNSRLLVNVLYFATSDFRSPNTIYSLKLEVMVEMNIWSQDNIHFLNKNNFTE